MQPHFLHSNVFLFDLGLRQFIHAFWLFSRICQTSILDRSCSKWDLVFDCVSIFIHYKTINLDSITNEDNKEHNEKWPYVPDHPYRIIIIGGFGSGKRNALLNLIKKQDYFDVIDKIYLHARDLSEPKYQFLIKKGEDAGMKHVNNSNAFIVCSNAMGDVYEDIDNYNPKRDKKSLNCAWWLVCRYYDK